MKKLLLAAGLAVGLSGCVLETVGTGIVIGTAAYCAGVSEAGKEALRDFATAGKKLVACEDAE